MKVDVYDTYAVSTEGKTIHFDALVQPEVSADQAYQFGLKWLNEIGQADATLKQSRCTFCHQEQAQPDVVTDIEKQGYYILQMDGCPNPIR